MGEAKVRQFARLERGAVEEGVRQKRGKSGRVRVRIERGKSEEIPGGRGKSEEK
jgi:hypothetical protein